MQDGEVMETLLDLIQAAGMSRALNINLLTKQITNAFVFEVKSF